MRNDDRRCRKERKWYRREVPPTLTDGGDTGERMCGRVETRFLSAVDVLTTGENEMVTLGIFVEPQLPMTHLKTGGEQSASESKRIGLWLTVGDRSAEVGEWAK